MNNRAAWGPDPDRERTRVYVPRATLVGERLAASELYLTSTQKRQTLAAEDERTCRFVLLEWQNAVALLDAGLTIQAVVAVRDI